jgi:hypothetical protein
MTCLIHETCVMCLSYATHPTRRSAKAFALRCPTHPAYQTHLTHLTQ